MIAPHANHIGFRQQSTCFLESSSHFVEVTQHYDLIHPLLAKSGQSRGKGFDPFMDVGKQAQFHGTKDPLDESCWPDTESAV
jgi:hypothetical protein